MNETGRVWRLFRGDEVLAELIVTGGDFPWLNAEVRPAVGFSAVRPLFDEELRRLDHLDEEPEQWEAVYRRIREVVRLLAPDGRPVPEFLLHIEGTDAWWRWSDEPFPERSRNASSALRPRREYVIRPASRTELERLRAGVAPRFPGVSRNVGDLRDLSR